MKEVFKLDNTVVYAPDKGLSPNGLASIWKGVNTTASLELLSELRSAYKSDFSKIEPVSSKDNTGFIEYLIEHIKDNTPKGLTSLLDVYKHLKNNVADFDKILDIFTVHKRSVYIYNQSKSSLASTTPLMLQALKRAGYSYMHWDINDAYLPKMLGEDLNALIQFRRREALISTLEEAFEDRLEDAEARGKPWVWLRDKKHPNPTSVKNISKKFKAMAKARGIEEELDDVTPTVIAILSNSWCNFNNHNNLESAIYSLKNWDSKPNISFVKKEENTIIPEIW